AARPKPMVPVPRKEIAMLNIQEAQTLNAFFLAGVVLWCMSQVGPNSMALASQSVADVTKALHYQPRTPPPVFEPEYIDLSEDSQERF
ncbi:MAG: hypothetical protein ACO386_07235, partial [Burkholderiaceae bacterium]